MADECVFCAIVLEQSRAWKVHEDDDTLAFLDIRPATRGHSIVIPKQHASDIWSIDRVLIGKVMQTAHYVAATLQNRFNPDGMSLSQSNGKAAGQDVFHFHIHVVPRYIGDQVVKSWPSDLATHQKLDDVLRTIHG